MYCGDHSHYAFLTEAFGLFAHQNALQRDMCPSATRFEGEIVAMALDLMHAGAVTDGEPAGMVCSGGTGSITHAALAYREHGRETRGIAHANIVKPETGHPAFDKACHLFGVELRRAPVDAETTLSARCGRRTDRRGNRRDRRLGRQLWVRDDRPDRAARRASRRSMAPDCTSTVASGASCSRSARSSAIRPGVRFRVSGVTSISADTHKTATA